jgi:hypothetical protein
VESAGGSRARHRRAILAGRNQARSRWRRAREVAELVHGEQDSQVGVKLIDGERRTREGEGLGDEEGGALEVIKLGYGGEGAEELGDGISSTMHKSHLQNATSCTAPSIQID